jgi:DNA-binding transcriptional LysR family regulator
MFLDFIVLNFYMIDPRLQTLRVLHQQGTVTATAKALYVTPSTVSQQLRALSREVGVDLVEASGRNIRLTPAALTLLEHADVLYAQWERALADLAEHQEGCAGLLRISSISSALGAIVAPAAAALRSRQPRLRVRMSEEESQHCFRQLLAGHTDIAVLLPTPNGPAPDDARFDQQPLLDEPQDLLVSTRHRLADRESVALAEVASDPFIASPDRVDQYQLLMSAGARAGFTPRIAHHGKDWIAIAAMVAHGFGVCLIPRLAHVPPTYPVVRIPLEGDPVPSRRLLTCIRRGSERQPAIALGLEALREVAAKADVSPCRR